MDHSYKITVNGEDRTRVIDDMFVSLSLTDKSGIADDEFELEVTRDEPRLQVPNVGDRVELALGYSDGQDYEEYRNIMINHGLYYLNERDFYGPKAKTLVLSFNPIDMASRFKEVKNRSFDGQTIKQIGETIALDNGLALRIEESLGNILIDHVDQVMQNDKHFISKLVSRYEGILKIANDFMVLARRENISSFSGESLEEITIDLTEVVDYHASEKIDSSYSGVKAFYRNSSEATTSEVVVGTIGNITSISQIYPTQEEAREAAQAKFNSLKRKTETLHIKVVGNPLVKAERVINAIGDPDINTKWVVSQVKHTIDKKKGYQTEIDCTAPKEKEKKSYRQVATTTQEENPVESSIERDSDNNIVTPDSGKLDQ